MKKKIIASALAAMAFAATAQAQIGYQVSLLNTATGEPRANVTVSAEVTITDSEGNTIHTGTQQATTNDFGVLSLTVGDAATFANADTGKMPFFIAVSVDETLIGRSQILSVPAAEVAGRLKSSFAKEELVGTWKLTLYYGDQPDSYFWTFYANGTVEYTEYHSNALAKQMTGEYEIEGNNIYTYGVMHDCYTGADSSDAEQLRWHDSKLYWGSNILTKQ